MKASTVLKTARVFLWLNLVHAFLNFLLNFHEGVKYFSGVVADPEGNSLATQYSNYVPSLTAGALFYLLKAAIFWFSIQLTKEIHSDGFLSEKCMTIIRKIKVSLILYAISFVSLYFVERIFLVPTLGGALANSIFYQLNSNVTAFQVARFFEVLYGFLDYFALNLKVANCFFYLLMLIGFEKYVIERKNLKSELQDIV